MSRKRVFCLRAFICVFVLLWSLGQGLLCHADDYETPHVFRPGDVISADTLNEVFETIANALATIEPSDIVGQWACTCCMPADFRPGDLDGTSVDPDVTVQWRTDTVTFRDDGDGTHSFSTDHYDLFAMTNILFMNSAVEGVYSIRNNVFYFRMTTFVENGHYVVEKVSETRFKLINPAHQLGVYTVCDKIHIPPHGPKGLSAVVSGFRVSLRWEDTSDDETGFEILRRNHLDAGYEVISTTGPDATSYEDFVPHEGTYWYRVQSANDHGKSIGSNVVKVTVED